MTVKELKEILKNYSNKDVIFIEITNKNRQISKLEKVTAHYGGVILSANSCDGVKE